MSTALTGVTTRTSTSGDEPNGATGGSSTTGTTVLYAKYGSKLQALKRAGQQQFAMLQGHVQTSDIRADTAIAKFRAQSDEMTKLEKELRTMSDLWRSFANAQQACTCIEKYAPNVHGAIASKEASSAVFEVLEERVFYVIKSTLGHIAGLEDLVKQRQELLMDHDHHLRVHKTCEQKVSSTIGDTVKHAAAEKSLAERTEKLSQAQQTLSASTEALLYKLEIYDRAHSKIILHVTETVCLVTAFDAAKSLSRTKPNLEAFDKGSALLPGESSPGPSNMEIINALLESKLVGEDGASNKATSTNGAATDAGSTVVRHVLEAAEISMQKESSLRQFGKPWSQFNPATSVLNQMIAFLEAPGPSGEPRIFTAEGIFRVSGDVEIVHNLRDQIERGCQLDDAAFLLGASVNEVADLLKMFLREFPSKLLPESFASIVDTREPIESVERRQVFVTSVTAATSTLPENGKDALCLLMNLLYRISHRSDVSKMTASNLASVFAPTVFNIEDLQGAPAKIKLLTILIEHAEEIWGDELLRYYPLPVSEMATV